MSYRLACELSDRIAAVAAVSAAMHLPFEQSRPSRPVSVLHIHGLADQKAPYKGGAGTGIEGGNKQAVPATTENWARLNGCAMEPRTVLEKGLTKVTYPGCIGGTAAMLVAVDGMDHQWPGA